MGKRKLGRKDIGEGFHDGALEVAQKKLHRHAEQLAGRHHAHLSRTMTVGAGVLHRARKQGKKALNQAKVRLIKEGTAKAHALHEKAMVQARKHLEQLKKSAINKVRSRVCEDVGSGFFGSIGNFFKGIFGGVKKQATKAISHGITSLKNKVAEAPTLAKAHLMKHKDEYLAKAKEAFADIATNGKEGVNRQLARAKKHLIKKTRGIAGCPPGKTTKTASAAEVVTASGLKLGGGLKVGGGLSVGGGARTKRKREGIRVHGGGIRIVR